MKLADILASLRGWLEPKPAIEASAERRDAITAATQRARQHLRAGRAAADQGQFEAAAALYGIALAGLAEAASAQEGEKEGAAARSFAASSRAGTEEGKDGLALLERPAEASTLDRTRVRRALGLLERAGSESSARLYPASDREVSKLRLRRQVAAAATFVAVVAGAVAYARSPRNVARGRPVTASSVRFGSPGALVNGAIEWGSFGLHTGGSGREWATIDLEKFRSLASAEIYSRGDGRLEFNLPLSVELSDDGSSFRPAGACKDLFTQATPCVVDLHKQRARYVRVTAPEVVLAEVEVYAEP